MTFDPGQDFSGVKINRVTSTSIHKTSVREKSRGVYLPIG